MKLITKEIKKRLEKYPLYSQDGKKEEAVCQAKFFLCIGAWSWFILEADLERTISPTESLSMEVVKASTATQA